jgi:pyruvate dehydrogenase E2 component (dihydrolipoamide acetyltransferase)
MPKWGIEMTEGTISEWSINQGDWVSQGQTIALIESDKIVNEVQAEFETRFVRLIAVAGESYPVGALLAVMASDEVTAAEVDAFIGAFRPAGAAGEVAAKATAAPIMVLAAEPVAEAPRAMAPTDGVRSAPRVLEMPPGIDISPQARCHAMDLNVDVRSVAGSGRRGRITLQDIEQASRPAHAVGGGAPVSIIPTTGALDVFYASPGAKRFALAHQVDLAKVRATGPRGRISRADVARDAGMPLRAADAEVIRMSPMRKAIARQLTLAKSTIPHYYLRRQVQLDALQSLRAELKGQKGSAPSLNDYLLRATALALCEVPDVNIQVHGDEIHRFPDANISVAVATERGLITPVLRAAQRKPAEMLAAELRPLVERARAGRLRAEEVEGGSFTVSNLGMFGVEQFDAIINPPQGAILAIGAARRQPVEREGGISFGSFAWLSVSCDHRAIDGALGGRFLAALCELIESPQRL